MTWTVFMSNAAELYRPIGLLFNNPIAIFVPEYSGVSLKLKNNCIHCSKVEWCMVEDVELIYAKIFLDE